MSAARHGLRTNRCRWCTRVRGTPFHAVNHTSRLDNLLAYGERQTQRTTNMHLCLKGSFLKGSLGGTILNLEESKDTAITIIITTKLEIGLVHGRWKKTVIDGKFKYLRDFEQKGGSCSAAGGHFADVNKYPSYIKDGTWLMTCPLTTTKLMLICSGSLMPFAPRVPSSCACPITLAP